MYSSSTHQLLQYNMPQMEYNVKFYANYICPKLKTNIIEIHSQWTHTKQYKCAVVSSCVSFSPNCSASSMLWLHKTHGLSDIFTATSIYV